MISEREVNQAYSDLRSVCGGLKEDYFGLLYLESAHHLERDQAVRQVAFGGHDYGVDGFHFDIERRNLYIYQFKYSKSPAAFKGSLERLLEAGMDRIFKSPNVDDYKNQIILQLRSCLIENRSLIEQVYFRFVFVGDTEEAERSQVLQKLKEDLEYKRHLVDQFFVDQNVRFIVEFRSALGMVASIHEAQQETTFPLKVSDLVQVSGPGSERMHIGFIRLADLVYMHSTLGAKLFDRNIRYGLGGAEAVNRAISRALRKIVIDRQDNPATFAFNHNGVTLYAEKLKAGKGETHLTAPRLLNGAQTVTTATRFMKENEGNPKFLDGKPLYDSITLLCRIITDADQSFVTQVTINNNRQNPVEPWNLHANDMIQLELQDKFQSELKLYYERQENSFSQLSSEDLAEYGIFEDSKAIQMIKLAQTFLVTDGKISRLSELRRVFEDDAAYKQVFRESRLRVDARQILLCYKVERCLRTVSNHILESGQKKYWFISRARNLLWALLCQGLLNNKNLEDLLENFGTSMVIQMEFRALLMKIASTRVRPLLTELMADAEYQDQIANDKFGFLRSDKAFTKCMNAAYKQRERWTHKKL